MLWQPSNKLLRYFLRRFVSHSLWGCCQFGDCSMKSLPFDISLSLGLLFTCHQLITSWSVLAEAAPRMLWQPSNNLLRYFLRRFVSHSLWGCCQFGDCSMKSLPFDISLSLGLLFTCHQLITSWSVLQKLRQGCFDNHQINCWDTFCGDSWAIRSEAVVSLEIVAWNPYRLIFLCHWVFFSHVISWLHLGLFLQKLRQGCSYNHQINCWDTFAEIREPFALRLLPIWRL